MIAQEKEEHKNTIKSIQSSNGTKNTNEDCPLLGQPARSVQSDRANTEGFSDFDIRFMDGKAFFPVSNTGATPPTPPTTKIDTISLSVKETPRTLLDFLIESLHDEHRGQVTWLGKSKGVNGYKSGVALLINKKEVAAIYHGCDHNQRQAEKPQIYIGGNGGTDHFDFFKMRHYLNQVESPSLTRVDISKDWYFGEVTLDDIKQAYIDGKFKNSNAPKNPKWTPIGAPNPIDGSHQGITYQIGSRQSAYYYRAYLKGYERLKSLLNCDDKTIVHRILETDGMMAFEDINNGEVFDVRQWLRGELELKAKNNNKLDLDVIVKPDNFYSGAYPYLSELINVGDGMRPKYLKKEDELEMSVRIQNAKAISGNTIEDMIFLGYTNEQIINELRSGKGASQKLIKAGLAQKRINELNKQN
jgi:DNA relaxase NicK